MAQITFEVLDVNGIYGSGLNGSGLGFYGSGGFGTSVPLFAYQGTTFLTNSAGGSPGGQTRNTEFISGVWGSSGVRLATTIESTGMLTKLNSNETTLMIHFDHDTKVMVQNCQLRIYDRDNVDSPASGVVTKVAEVANFGGNTYTSWVSTPGNDFTSVIGSGDAFWWGAPWKKEALYDTTGDGRPYYQNSVGVKFYNFTDKMDLVNSGNPDVKLSTSTYPAKQTVGGTGIIVPLLDSPCSGGRGLASGAMYPKFVQYINTAYQTNFGVAVPRNTGDVGVLAATYGGTSGDLRHTWRIAISASPLSIGSKTSYGMYISLEYL